MRRYALWIPSLLLLMSAAAFAVRPTVSNVNARQVGNTDQVEVTYDVQDPDTGSLLVQLEISMDGGKTWRTRVSATSGDIGTVSPGSNKRIVWDAVRDVGEAMGDDFVARVLATDSPATVGMVYIPAGEFVFASDFEPVEAFYIDRLPVTIAEYNEFADTLGFNPSRAIPQFRADPFSSVSGQVLLGPADHPATLPESQGASSHLRAGYYCASQGKRLPTWTEWVWAGRGFAGGTHPWGEGVDSTVVNLSGTAMPVGSFPAGASPFGVLDMAGEPLELVYEENVSNGWARPVKGMTSGLPRALNDRSGRSGDFAFRCAVDAQ